MGRVIPFIQWALIVLMLAGCAALQPQDKADKVFALGARADSLYRQGEYSQAADLYLKITHILPEHVHNWLRLGNSYAQLDNYDGAVSAYQHALAQDPKYAKAWINLTYVRAQQLASTAAQMYQAVPKNDPDVVQVNKLVKSVLRPFDAALPSEAQPVEKDKKTGEVDKEPADANSP